MRSSPREDDHICGFAQETKARIRLPHRERRLASDGHYLERRRDFIQVELRRMLEPLFETFPERRRTNHGMRLVGALIVPKVPVHGVFHIAKNDSVGYRRRPPMTVAVGECR